MTDDKKGAAEARKAIGRAAAGALTAQVVAGHVPPTVAALATAAGGALLPEVFRATVDRAQRRLANFLGECRAFYGRPSSPDPDGEVEVDVEAEVLDALSAPDTRDATLDALRAALDAVDDAAVPCIARAMRDYTSRSARPDRFYRGALRMFVDCDGTDLDVLRRCLSTAAELSGSDRELVFFGLTINGSAEPVMRKGRLTSEEHPNMSLGMENAQVRRAIWLLQTNGLGNESPTHGGVGIELERDVVERLADLLGSEPQPPLARRGGGGV